MKYIYTLLGFLLSLGSIAQNKQTQKADKLFESQQYAAAIDAYEDLVEKNKADTYVFKQLADSYYYVSNLDKAQSYYSKAIESNQNAETYYNYAQALKSQGNYDEAKKQMDAFADLLPNDQRAKDHKANPNYITDLKSLVADFEVKETTINSKSSSDFSALLTNDGLVYFVSTRNDGNKTDTWSGTPYLDIYQADYANGEFSDPLAVKALNSNYHDGPMTLSSDGNTMYFSRDGLESGNFDKNKKTNTKKGTLGIYRAEKVQGEWTNITPLPINSTKYSVGNPSLSADGKTLYFASNMPGGLGDTDIWKVSVNGKSYGKPVNLGNKINTPGKESFPFISEDNILYFASNGKQGFGGFDIFKVDLNSNQGAINLGLPVNSKKDDFAFTFNTQNNIGFISSNRMGLDNIYSVHPICKSLNEIVIKDAITKSVISNVTVNILNKDNVLKTEKSSNDGKVLFKSKCGHNYTIRTQVDGYDSQTVSIETSKSNSTVTEILLQPTEKDDVVITAGEVVLKPILFDFNKSTITQDSKHELDKLVRVMNTYPEMVILVKSHTDTKGKASYNLILSEQRAKATVDYITSKGIAKERISGKGMGETEPKITCGNHCTEKEHTVNRRSEFIIVKK